jgi:hypothetical protein
LFWSAIRGPRILTGGHSERARGFAAVQRSVKTGDAGGDPLPCAPRGKKIDFYLEISKIFFIFFNNKLPRKGFMVISLADLFFPERPSGRQMRTLRTSGETPDCKGYDGHEIMRYIMIIRSFSRVERVAVLFFGVLGLLASLRLYGFLGLLG